jgi:thiopeptide-type bacteriocin biosynthesis protein
VHLRLRLSGDPERLRGDALPALEAAIAPWLEDGRVWRVQLDTYEREVERYGGPRGIEACEAIFHADSRAVAALLALAEGDRRDDRRWRLALLGMDRLLDDLGLDAAARVEALKGARDAFRAEFRVDGPASGRLGAKYRAESAAVAALLSPEPADPVFADARRVLERRSAEADPACRALAALAREGGLGEPLAELARSLLHMHANRMLRSAARAQELVLYEFLHKVHEGRLARRAAPRPAREEAAAPRP